MSDWKEDIGGCFAFDAAPFAMHATDENLAFELLKRLRDEQVGWQNVEDEIRLYLNAKTSENDWVEQQLSRAEAHFKPWLSD